MSLIESPWGHNNWSVIYADPPWDYNDSRCVGKQGVDHQYPTLTPTDLEGLCVGPSIGTEDSVLFLWATWPRIEAAIEVMRSWGYSYKSIGFVWIKLNPKPLKPDATPKHGPVIVQPDGSRHAAFYGLGRWTRGNTEVVLIGVRGKPKRVDSSVYQLVFAPRAKHSAKPAEVRDRIVQLMGDQPRIELFAREIAPGWDAWGADIGGEVYEP